jgi:type II secretory pathway pseudopilin PulG
MKNFLKINVQQSSVKGFTLLETLTSIAILSFVIIGPLSVIISSSSYARQTKDVIVGTYLAEEAIELLQNQYDSLYIYCKNHQDQADPLCGTVTNETPGEITWRLFKERLGPVGGQPTCYAPSKCAFDFQDMTGDPTVTPPRYTYSGPGATECPYLVAVTRVITGGEGQPAETLQTYACKGVPAHITGGTVSNTQFARSISVEQASTFSFESTLPQAEQYNDDLRISSEVTFKGVNGVSKSVKVTRFFHRRP